MSALLFERWASREMVGQAAPRCRVLIRPGRFARAHVQWPTSKADALYVNAKVYGEKKSRPWAATWTPLGDWRDIPNISSVELTQDFDSNGITVATIVIDNVVLSPVQGPFGQVYHLIERGYLSPFRGGYGPAAPTPRNEWYDLLSRNAQIIVYQGYGDEAMVPVWTGLIDDCDTDSAPDEITITARDFGQALTDQDVFGWTITPALPEPLIFRSLGIGADGTVGTGVGLNPTASSSQSGHPPRFVVDTDTKTSWYSEAHGGAPVTEWIQVRLPRGRYQSIAIHPAVPNMEMFIGVFARSGGLGGEPATVDDVDIEDGWITPDKVSDPNTTGIVPGTNGGWPYIMHWRSAPDKAFSVDLNADLQLGDDSVIRVGWRNLYKQTSGVYRAGVERLAGVKRSDPTPVQYKATALVANASSFRSDSDNYAITNVLDDDKSTRWLSIDHTIPGVTEWVQIGVPKGKYASLKLDPAYAGMDVYLGVKASSLNLGGKCKMSGKEIDDGWVDVGLGDVPGANGGWPYVRYIPELDRPQNIAHVPLGHTFEVGDGTYFRVGLRNLTYVSHQKYRGGVTTLKAMKRVTSADKDDDTANNKVVAVGDLSDAVKCALRWAGFKEWDIEPVGAPLKGTAKFNRANTLMDIINAACAATGYVFSMGPPSGADNSIGVPSFRSNQAITDAVADMPIVTDQDLLTDVQAKYTDDPLSYIIRVRGKGAKTGSTLGADTTKRIMATYRPPWTNAYRLSGLLKHATHTEPKLTKQLECLVMAQLIALQEALIAYTAQIQLPGIPGLELNQQIGLVDTGSGLNTRMFIAHKASTYTAGENASWTTTLGGALLDVDDLRNVIADLKGTLVAMGGDPNKISLGQLDLGGTS